MKWKEKYREFFEDIKPVTDKELEELLEPPRRQQKKKKK